MFDDAADCVVLLQREKCSGGFDAGYMPFRQKAEIEEDGEADLVARTERSVFWVLIPLPVFGEIGDDVFLRRIGADRDHHIEERDFAVG